MLMAACKILLGLRGKNCVGYLDTCTGAGVDSIRMSTKFPIKKIYWLGFSQTTSWPSHIMPAWISSPSMGAGNNCAFHRPYMTRKPLCIKQTCVLSWFVQTNPIMCSRFIVCKAGVELNYFSRDSDGLGSNKLKDPLCSSAEPCWKRGIVQVSIILVLKVYVSRDKTLANLIPLEQVPKTGSMAKEGELGIAILKPCKARLY